MKKKGFTLVELLVASAILFILLESMYSFFYSHYKILQEEKKKAYIESQVKSFMDFTMQSLQMAFQEKITVKNHDVHTNKKELEIYVPKDNNQIDFSEDKSYKIEIYNLDDEIYISKTNGVSTHKSILDGHIKEFNITTKPEIISENTNIEYVQIDFKVDYKIRNITRNYSIKYNIRR